MYLGRCSFSFTDTSPTLRRLFADTSPIVGRYLTDVSVSNWPTLGRWSVDTSDLVDSQKIAVRYIGRESARIVDRYIGRDSYSLFAHFGTAGAVVSFVPL